METKIISAIKDSCLLPIFINSKRISKIFIFNDNKIQFETNEGWFYNSRINELEVPVKTIQYHKKELST